MSNENLNVDEAKEVVEALKQKRQNVDSAIQKIEKQIELGVLTDSVDFDGKQFLTE
jgi:(p)ppGpp synthase/HD superfamily hydrolase